MLYLATTCASEEIDEWVFELAFGCWIVSAILVVVALGLLIFGKAGVRRLAAAGAGLGFFPFCFAAYVYEIDYVAVGGDGTPASGPLWEALLVPGLPLLASLLVMWGRIAAVGRGGSAKRFQSRI